MSRNFDHNKNNYGGKHRAYKGQQARHILGNDFMEHYGCKPANYQDFSNVNYRMGSSTVNGRDTRVDNALVSEIFEGTRCDNLGGYDAARLARGGVSYQQQLDRVHNRFAVAKAAYENTGEYKYFMMQKDLRGVADQHLNADMREFRLSHR